MIERSELSYGLIRRISMFDSLSDQIKADDRKEISIRERAMRYSLIVVLSVILFIGLYVVVRMAS
jgi:hypothetical protein